MQKDFFKEIFDNSHDLIQSVSPKGEILYVNKTWLRKLGYRKSDLKELNIFQIIHPDSIDHCTNIFQKIMKQETSISIDKFKLIKKNGESIILEGYASSKFENINPLYTRGIFRDITEVSKTSKNLEILTYITQKLNETNNPEEAYRTALDKVIELDNVDIASIYIVDKQSNEAVLVDHRNLSKQYLKRASRIPFPKGLTWKLINTGKILNVKNIQNIKELGKAGRKLGIRSFVGIPINIDKKTIGVFWLLSIKEHSFNKNEVSLLNSIGNQIAISIARSTIYGELVKKNRYDEIISSVVKSVHSSIDLQEVFENTVNALINNIDIINHVGLHIVEKDIAVMKAYRGHPKWFVDIVKKLKRPRGFTWKTINNGKLYYCSDVSKDDAIGPAGRKVGTKSYVSVPIKIEQNTIGCINVHSNLIDPFSKDELTLLEKVTSEIAIAINNAKYVDELNKKKHYDEIISSVVNSVHSSIDLQQVFENTVEALINNIKVINHVGLHIVEGDVAVMRAYRGHPKWFVDIVKRLERPRGFTWKTIIDSKLHYCPDVSKDKAIGPAGRKVGTNSYISVPITISAKTIGCINVHSKLIDPFGEGDLKLLENVTNQIAVAIDNARQAEQLKDSEKSLKENIELLTKKQRLDEISNTILQSVHKSLDVKTIMHNAVNAITDNMPVVENMMIFLVEGDKAILQAHKGYPDWMVNRLKVIPKGKGFTWKAISSSKFLYVRDAEKDKVIGEAGKKLGTKSYIAVPIKLGRKTIGVLNINSLQKNAFDKDDIAVLNKIPKQLEIAINNANKAEALTKSENKLKENVLLLENKSKYDKILTTISATVHESIDLQTVFESAANSLVDNLENVDNVSIFLVEGDRAVIKAFKGLPKWFIDKTKSLPYPKGYTWDTIIKGKTRYCSDVDKDKVIGPAGRKVGIKSYFSVPFNYKGQTVGCINFNSKTRNAFNNDELTLLENITIQIESAIKNAFQAEALRQSEQRYKALFDQSPIGVYIFNKHYVITNCNDRMVEIIGSSREKIIGLDMKKLRDKIFMPVMEEALNGKISYDENIYNATTIDKTVWLSLAVTPLINNENDVIGGLAVVEDITERKNAEQKIKASLEEKELLLRELHHRVKNNLQIVSSLLSLQSHSLDDEKMLELLSASKSRIDSMALIHEQLYASPDFENIDLSVYVRNLCRYIRDYANIDPNSIKMNLKIDSIIKNINFAIPFSLIINELISNAYKHAFPDNRTGEINLSIKRIKKDKMILTVNDNGIGIPTDIDIDTSQSMGMQLISALAQQLHAKININRNNGTTFEFIFSGSE